MKNSPPIKDAAAMIVLDISEAEPRVLMGQRNTNLVFMPGKFVFPGGRVERGDSFLEVDDELSTQDMTRLLYKMEGLSGAHAAALRQNKYNRARALALAAIRETYEETGIIIGTAAARAMHIKTQPKVWESYLQHNVKPKLSALRFVARAITPPNRPRRYDTRFFCTYSAEIAKVESFKCGELTTLKWLSFEEAKAQELPRITKAVLEDIENHSKIYSHNNTTSLVPFYYMQNNFFRRDLVN